jgi:nitrogen regulatory protein PII
MNDLKGREDQLLTLVIVESEMGGKILSESRNKGITGGTIFLGRGTIRNPILKAFGLDEAKKEIVLMVTPFSLRDEIHDHLTEKFHMNKPNHGIILTLNIKEVFGLHSLPEGNVQKGEDEMNYEVIFTVVKKGLGQQVVDAATSAGSTGATIINARGAGNHEYEKFFAMELVPEKEIVMIIIDKDKTKGIIKAIEESVHIDNPGKGILFTMDANRVTGLYNSDNDNKK